MEGRTENITSEDNISPGDKIYPWKTTSPLGSKFAPRGEVKNGPLAEKVAATYGSFLFVGFASFADEVLVLGDVLRPQADAEQVEPELAAVALDPVNLERNRTTESRL
jgi:hypothetical protein